jgi:hypothetical protein
MTISAAIDSIQWRDVTRDLLRQAVGVMLATIIMAGGIGLIGHLAALDQPAQGRAVAELPTR